MNARADDGHDARTGEAARHADPALPPAQGAGDRAARRQREKEARLAARGDRILDALATLITRWGFGKTTVDDVAREAGVAKGTVYLHWPTKGAMLHALLEREEQQWNAIVLERLAADPRGGTISGIYRHALALGMENPLLRALLTQDRDALGEWTRSPQSRARARRRMEGMHALIGGLRAAGSMRTDLSVAAQAYLVAALSYGMLTLEEYMPAEFVPPPEEAIDAFAAALRRALEPDIPEGEDARAAARGHAAAIDLAAGILRSLTAGQASPRSEAGAAPRDGQRPEDSAGKEGGR